MGNIQAAEVSVKENLLTEANLTEVLKRTKGTGAKTISWTVKDMTDKGDNYVAVVASVCVKYELNGLESYISFVVKLGLPLPTAHLQEGINFAFIKEAKIYQELVPQLNSQLTSIGQRALRLPECYYTALDTAREMIYLEDLRELGFRTLDRRFPLNSPHVKLVMKEMARFHAAYVLLEGKSSYEDLGSTYPYVDEDFYDRTEEMREMTKEVLNKSIQKAIHFLSGYDKYKKVVQWMKSVSSSSLEEISAGFKKKSKFSALCHCDCWNGNLLFRYDANGNPLEVRMIDLQLLRRGSIAQDLKMFFYHSVGNANRSAEFHDYFDIYYNTFDEVMKAGGRVTPFTRDELTEEYKKQRGYAFFISMTWVPLVLCETDNIPEDSIADEVGNSKSSGNSSGPLTDKEKRDFLRMFENNKELTDRYLALMDDLMGTL